MSNPVVLLAAKDPGHGHSATTVCGARVHDFDRSPGTCPLLFRALPGLDIRPYGLRGQRPVAFLCPKAHVWLF
jgi:hypothetical protein